MNDTEQRNVLASGSIPFTAEGRLIQELGLRLVASPEVALVELIKNAYDADSPSCKVELKDKERTLVVSDQGQGMAFADFRDKWMRIATHSKLAQEFSPKYTRRLTGSKGIGRFAVRYLGNQLKLESVALDSERGCATRLTAEFDWAQLDQAGDLSRGKVHYELVRVSDDTPTGTILTVTKLRSAAGFARSSLLRGNVLRLVSPISVLESGKFAATAHGGKEDPGFAVFLPGEGAGVEDVSLAKMVLDNYWARLTIQLDGGTLEFRVYFPGSKKPRTLQVDVNTAISKGLFADIRYFPRRAGVFAQKGVDGRKAWNWVRENCGVAVVDHGFRMSPYGFKDDDWLHIDLDRAHRRRDWRSKIANDRFRVPDSIKGIPTENPVLFLPYNFQLVGAVFIESKRTSGNEEQVDLVPAMDREGLLVNAGYEQLAEYVRAGIEFLAKEDKAELDRLAEQEATETARKARTEIREVIETIRSSTGLTSRDKANLVGHYSALADRLEEQEDYSAQARRGLLTMSLLGVVAGFMTHESEAAEHRLGEAVELVRTLSQKHPELLDPAKDLSQHLERFRAYRQYSRLFVRKAREQKDERHPAAAQVRHIVSVFGDFAAKRNVDVITQIKSDIVTPPLPIAVYSGILLNLYTNALKAVLSAGTSVREPRICFRGWNEDGRHILEVADNGVGIPPQMRKRIWEPLYSTTSDGGGPLGSGMGLGLPLVRQVAAEYGGTVTLVPAPPKYTTCFRVVFRERKD
jgi:signal transduction histidine kinase